MSLLTADECKYIVEFYDDNGVEIKDRRLSVPQMLQVARNLFYMNDKRWLRMINALVHRVARCGPEEFHCLGQTSYIHGEFYKLTDEERFKVNDQEKEEG